MCSAAEADAVDTKFAERMKNIEGGPLQLKQTTEGIRLCAAAKAKRVNLPLQFASR